MAIHTIKTEKLLNLYIDEIVKIRQLLKQEKLSMVSIKLAALESSMYTALAMSNTFDDIAEVKQPVKLN